MYSVTVIATVLLSVAVQQGSSIGGDCYTTLTFGCNGAVGTPVDDIADCCQQGFLAFLEDGVDACQVCSSNVICHGSSNCSDDADFGLGAMSRDACCTNAIGGWSYLNRAVMCKPCEPRTPDPTTPTPAPTTMATTVTTTTTDTTATTEEITVPGEIGVVGTTEEITVPGEIGVVGGELGGSPVNIGAVVGGVIGGVVAVAAITMVTVVIIVLVLRARPTA